MLASGGALAQSDQDPSSDVIAIALNTLEGHGYHRFTQFLLVSLLVCAAAAMDRRGEPIKVVVDPKNEADHPRGKAFLEQEALRRAVANSPWHSHAAERGSSRR
jgi:hypothetical protein